MPKNLSVLIWVNPVCSTKRIFKILIILLNVIFFCSNVLAIEISHTSPQIDDIPPLGEMLVLKIFLKKSKVIDLPIRLVAVLDDKLIDVPFQSGTLTSDDKAAYTIEIPSPVKYIKYQFVGLNEDKKLFSSSWYSINRGCNLNTTPISVSADELQYNDNLDELFRTSQMLEHEIKAYRTSLGILQEIIANTSAPEIDSKTNNFAKGKSE